jgi:hypothetical protein
MPSERGGLFKATFRKQYVVSPAAWQVVHTYRGKLFSCRQDGGIVVYIQYSEYPCLDVIPRYHVHPQALWVESCFFFAFVLNMATVEEIGVAALVYDYLLKKDISLAQIFQKKTKAVSVHTHVHCIFVFNDVVTELDN